MHPMLLEDILKQFKCLTFRNQMSFTPCKELDTVLVIFCPYVVIFCPSYLKEILKYHKKLK